MESGKIGTDGREEGRATVGNSILSLTCSGLRYTCINEQGSNYFDIRIITLSKM